MTGGQWAVLLTALACITSGAVFLVLYSVRASWWRSHVGRMMVTWAVAITLLNVLAAFGSAGADLEVVRYVRAGLTVVLAAMFVFQTYLVVVLQRRRE